MLLEGWEFESLTGSGEVQLPNFEALVFVGGPDWVGNSVRLLGPFYAGRSGMVSPRTENQSDCLDH